jgi:hypothetical protein
MDVNDWVALVQARVFPNGPEVKPVNPDEIPEGGGLMPGQEFALVQQI